MAMATVLVAEAVLHISDLYKWQCNVSSEIHTFREEVLNESESQVCARHIFSILFIV
jgi:hypothetical protein